MTPIAAARSPHALAREAVSAVGARQSTPEAGLARAGEDAVRHRLRAGRRRADDVSSTPRSTIASAPSTLAPATEMDVLRRRPGPLRPGRLGGPHLFHLRRRLSLLPGRRDRQAPLEVSRRPRAIARSSATSGSSRPGRRAAPRSSPTARSTSPPASGRSWASSSTPSTPAPAAVVWTNDGDGSLYMKQPHNTDAFASIAPQGPLVVHRRHAPGPRRPLRPRLLRSHDRQAAALPAGRERQARRRLGSRRHRRLSSSTAAASSTSPPRSIWPTTASRSSSPRTSSSPTPTGICRVLDLKTCRRPRQRDTDDVTGKKTQGQRAGPCPSSPRRKIVERADTHDQGRLAPLLSAARTRSPCSTGTPTRSTLTPSWNLNVEGKVVRLIAADDRLFAVTREGRIYCFAGQETKPVAHARTPCRVRCRDCRRGEGEGRPDPRRGQRTRGLRRRLGRRRRPARRSAGPAERAASHRRRAGCREGPGRSAAAGRMPTSTARASPSCRAIRTLVQLPPYLASVMVCEDLDDAAAPSPARAASSPRRINPAALRRHAVLRRPPTHAQASFRRSPPMPLPAPGWRSRSDLVTDRRAKARCPARRTGPTSMPTPPTRASRSDQLVKAPLGVLWFGGPSHEGILPRHGHGPQPQVIDGRHDHRRRRSDPRHRHLHRPAPLGNAAARRRRVLQQPVASARRQRQRQQLRLDLRRHLRRLRQRLRPARSRRPARRSATFQLPEAARHEEAPRWGYINVDGDYLIGGADPLFDPKTLPPKLQGRRRRRQGPGARTSRSRSPSCSRRSRTSATTCRRAGTWSSWIATPARCSGQRRRKTASATTPPASAAAGSTPSTASPATSSPRSSTTARSSTPVPRSSAFDLATGKELWHTDDDVFGTWLSYSDKHDVLVEAGRVARDTPLRRAEGHARLPRQGRQGALVSRSPTSAPP